MEILELLNFYNKWWLTDKVPKELYKEFKRDVFSRLASNLAYGATYNRMISLIGLRRTGKTTLLYQLINHLLTNGISARRILFLNISDPLIANNPEAVEKLFDEYQKNTIKENLTNLIEPVYFFLDEIQYLPKWELFLKRYIDQKFKIKFIITGSASLKITKKTKESLVGRINEEKIYPFSFKEFIQYKDHLSNTKTYEKILINIKSHASKDSIFISHLIWKYQSFSLIWKRLKEKKLEISNLEQELKILLNEYIERGGFPEIIELDNQELGYRYLIQDVLDRILTQDIPQFAQVRDPNLLQTLLVSVARNSGSTFSYENISKNTGARIETIRNYFQYLVSSFLISILTKFKKTELAKFKSKKKYYIADLGLRSAILKLSKQTIHSDNNKGISAEILVTNSLKNQGENISFWQDGKNEVDIVLKISEQTVPIEVKFRNNIKLNNLKGLMKFIEKYKTGGGIVITESFLDFKNNLLFIPLSFFLLLY